MGSKTYKHHLVGQLPNLFLAKGILFLATSTEIIKRWRELYLFGCGFHSNKPYPPRIIKSEGRWLAAIIDYEIHYFHEMVIVLPRFVVFCSVGLKFF